MAKEEPSIGAKLKNSFLLRKNYHIKPIGFEWRSHTLFIVATVGTGMFLDLFLYCLVVPILPFLLRDHIGVPQNVLQRYTSQLLGVYALATLLLCPVAGWISDKLNSRQIPFLGGLLSLLVATIMFFTGTTIPVLVIARILQGASSAFVWTIGMALAMDTVGPGNQGKTIGTLFSICSVGEVLAPAVGGIIYQKLGSLYVLALCLVLIALDLFMRICMIEKKDAACYIAAAEQDDESTSRQNEHSDTGGTTAEGTATEETPLLTNGDNQHADEEEAEKYHIPKDQPALIKAVPVLYPLFHSSSLFVAFFVTFGLAFLVSAYDATVPIHAADMYGFNAMEAALLFVPMATVSLFSGPLCGWLVDLYGVKWPTVFGFSWFVPFLVLLRLPKPEPYPQQVYFWAALLGCLGVGVSFSGSGSIVEGARVVDLYDKHNPGFFGDYGPYNQMCGIMSMFFNLGMSTGPILGGELKELMGYGNMNAVLAGTAAFMMVSSLVFLGGRPACLKRKHANPDIVAA